MYYKERTTVPACQECSNINIIRRALQERSTIVPMMYQECYENFTVVGRGFSDLERCLVAHVSVVTLNWYSLCRVKYYGQGTMHNTRYGSLLRQVVLKRLNMRDFLPQDLQYPKSFVFAISFCNKPRSYNSSSQIKLTNLIKAVHLVRYSVCSRTTNMQALHYRSLPVGC